MTFKITFPRYSEGKQVIIFCSSKNGTENLTFQLSKIFISIIMTEAFQFDDSKLNGLITIGVGYHHAGNSSLYSPFQIKN